MKSGFLMSIGFKLQDNANEHFWFLAGKKFLKRSTINVLNYALILRRNVFSKKS
jgi:hypothetical protein